MNEALAVFVPVILFSGTAGVVIAIMWIHKKKTGIDQKSKTLDDHMSRVAVLSRKFDLRTPRYVVVKPFNPADPEYRKSLDSVARSEAFRWFMYQLRERVVEQLKGSDYSNANALISNAAFITAVDEIQAALAVNAQELINPAEGEDEDEKDV